MQDYLTEVLRASIAPLVDLVTPAQRVYWVFWVSALILALWILRRRGLRQALAEVGAPSVWWHPSARADYRLLFVKPVLAALLFGPWFLSSLAVAAVVSALLVVVFGRREPLPFGAGALVLFSLGAFVAEDFGRYWIHRLMHRVPVLWELHKVHHSAEVLTPFTLYRTHPIEAALNGVTSALSVGVVTGVFYYGFGGGLTGLQILGVDAFGFGFSLVGANLRHSHVWMSWGAKWERYFISPAQHQIHHSVERIHHDKNFGVFLAIWDRFAGSLVLSDKARDFAFGLPAAELTHAHTVRSMLWHPLVGAWRVLFRRRAKVGSASSTADLSG